MRSENSYNSQRSDGQRSDGQRGEGQREDGQKTFVRRQFFRRRKSCPFSGQNALKIDYKDVRVLSKFVSESGKMMPSRISSVSLKKQRELAQAIKRARFLALMPYVNG